MEELKSLIARGRNFLKSNWHLTEGAESDQGKGVRAPSKQKARPEGSARVPLVPAEKLSVGDMPLIRAIAERQSRRKFARGSLTREELSYLLWATQGIKKSTPKYSLRTVPSGGARHSFETYLYIARAEEMDQGLYRFLPIDHALCMLDARKGLAEELDEALLGQYWDAAAVFIWTTIPYRMEWRYSCASAKIIAIDVGHVCQNLYLACEAIGCGTCGVGAYHQRKMDDFLGVDGVEEFALYMAPVGKAI
jgi:SagB-type dehydrogenase family enzyme